MLHQTALCGAQLIPIYKITKDYGTSKHYLRAAEPEQCFCELK